MEGIVRKSGRRKGDGAGCDGGQWPEHKERGGWF